MTLHSQSFNTENTTLDIPSKHYKVSYYEKMQSILTHHKVNIIN